jgi:hypothetical protein
LLDLVAQRNLEFFHHAGVRRGNFHRGFVGLHRDQTLLGLDGVAGLDQQLDHSHLVKVANVGNLNIDQCHRFSDSNGVRATPGRWSAAKI